MLSEAAVCGSADRNSFAAAGFLFQFSACLFGDQFLNGSSSSVPFASVLSAAATVMQLLPDGRYIFRFCFPTAGGPVERC